MSRKRTRRKKLRNPSPEQLEASMQPDQPGNGQPRNDKPRDEDLEYLNQLPPEQRRKWMEDGERIYKALNTAFMRVRDEPFTAAEAFASLGNLCRFLGQVSDASSEVMETVDPQALRKLVAAEMPLPKGVAVALKAIGADPEEITRPQPAEEPAQNSPQKRPRGARHPLITLITLGVQAGRLEYQIIKGLFPHLVNELTVDEKNERFREKCSQAFQDSLARIGESFPID
jgi:hypothetical protein